jgi:DNA-binding transcriptional ArsR family regulator
MTQRQALDWAWSRSLPFIAKPVLLALAFHADHCGMCEMTIGDLGHLTGLSRRSVAHALLVLQDRGLVRIDSGKQTGEPNRYWCQITARGGAA